MLALGRAVVVICNSRDVAAMTIERLDVAEAPVASVTINPTPNVPEAEGEPEIAPLLNVKPAGKDSADQL